MILEVYDKNTRERLDIIKTYTFVQYTKYFNKVGTFRVTVPLSEESLQYLTVKGNYILFDEETMGVIKYFKKDSLQSSSVEIKGYLLNHIFEYRSFLYAGKYSGPVCEIERKMVSDMFLTSPDPRRIVDFIMLDETYPESEKISYQDTGKTLSDNIILLNDTYGFGYDVVPVLQKYSEASDKPTNVSGFKFIQKKPRDLTVGNKEGNTPVVFSGDLNNLSQLSYENDDTEFCSTAFVAGEGEGEDRKTLEVGDTEASGLDRIELYVDARDIQSDEGSVIDDDEPSESTTYSSSKIEELIEQSGGGGVQIDDNHRSKTTTYSSDKIEDIVEDNAGAQIDDDKPSSGTTYSSEKIEALIKQGGGSSFRAVTFENSFPQPIHTRIIDTPSGIGVLDESTMRSSTNIKAHSAT